MPPRRSFSIYRDLRVQPAGNFYVEGPRTRSRTPTTQVAWRLDRPCRDLNVNNINSVD
jgi:hypothetical protein